MATTQHCCGDFVRGQPGLATNPNTQCFANCCKTCPPDNCCDEIHINFDCGSSKNCEPEYEAGCDCPPVALMPDIDELTLADMQSDAIVAFEDDLPPPPTFDFESEVYPNWSDTVFAQENGCGSIPCTSIQVTLTTSGCCLELSGNTIYAVGAGDISAKIDPSSYDDCGEFTVLVNGNSPPYFAMDGEEISVTLQPSNTDECGCCERSKTNPCVSGAMWATRTESGKTILMVNRKLLIQRMNKMKKLRIQQRMNKLRRSKG